MFIGIQISASTDEQGLPLSLACLKIFLDTILDIILELSTQKDLPLLYP